MAKKVLIVEDYEDFRELLKLAFAQSGYSVITAEDGREGLNKALAEHPDVIVTNLSMPHINGLELVKRVRADPDLKEVPIIVISATNKEIAEPLLAVGAEAILAKPVEMALLLKTVYQALKRVSSRVKT